MESILGIIIFDHLNDAIYLNYNEKFSHHINSLAVNQGYIDISTISSDTEHSNQEEHVDPNIIVQLFSPLVASHNIMGSQFDQAYKSIKCKDGTKLFFKEYANYVFLCIGHLSEAFLERYLNICIQFVKVIVGPCVSLLKRNPEKSTLLNDFLATWKELFFIDQSYLVEAFDRLIANLEISSISIKALSTIVDGFKKCKHVTSGHALFFVRNKLLALYSSPQVEDLSSSDMLIINLLTGSRFKASICPCLKESFQHSVYDADEQDVFEAEESDIDQGSHENSTASSEDTNIFRHGNKISEYTIFLRNKRFPLSPHLVYVYRMTSEVTLVSVLELNRSAVAGELIQLLSIIDYLKGNKGKSKGCALLDSIDTNLRKAQEYMNWFPKETIPRIRSVLSKVSSLWESLRKGLQEWLKSSEVNSEFPSRLEAPLSVLREVTLHAWQTVCFVVDNSSSFHEFEDSCQSVERKMSNLFPLLESSAVRDMSLGSSSLMTINKYMEEFPGLVHFLYIDRSNHYLTTPVLWNDLNQDNDAMALTQKVTFTKVWSMVEFARENLKNGHLSLLWKDKTFSYSYFLWFEDISGEPLLADPVSKEDLKSLPVTGILCDDFYKAFVSLAFPTLDPSKIRIYEMFCVHLGLATSPCVLEQTRRLAATVWEISSPQTANPVDLF